MFYSISYDMYTCSKLPLPFLLRLHLQVWIFHMLLVRMQQSHRLWPGRRPSWRCLTHQRYCLRIKNTSHTLAILLPHNCPDHDPTLIPNLEHCLRWEVGVSKPMKTPVSATLSSANCATIMPVSVMVRILQEAFCLNLLMSLLENHRSALQSKDRFLTTRVSLSFWKDTLGCLDSLFAWWVGDEVLMGWAYCIIVKLGFENMFLWNW